MSMAKRKRYPSIPDKGGDSFAPDSEVGRSCAVGHDSYVISEIEEQTATKEKLDRIVEKYGNRDALRWEIVAYLWSIGRFLELASEITRH